MYTAGSNERLQGMCSSCGSCSARSLIVAAKQSNLV
jgi:hypothetical protein